MNKLIYADLELLSDEEIVTLCESTNGPTYEHTYNTSKGHIKVFDYNKAVARVVKSKQHGTGRPATHYWPKYVQFLVEGYLIDNKHSQDSLMMYANEKYAEVRKEILPEPRSKQYAQSVIRAFKDSVKHNNHHN